MSCALTGVGGVSMRGSLAKAWGMKHQHGVGIMGKGIRGGVAASCQHIVQGGLAAPLVGMLLMLPQARVGQLLSQMYMPEVRS